MAINPISPSIPLDQDGVYHGHLKLPYSRDDSAWGSIMIPITVVQNGEGPTALITGGNHGDEYEGPIAILDMAATLQATEIKGRVILVPYLNYPAFLAGKRTSPIDGANMNRIFPGQADGTPSQKVADYFQNTLLPIADIVLDFHSGGRTLDFLPFAASHVLDDKSLEAKCVAARDAFNAPFSVAMREIDAVGMYDTAAEDMGKVFISTELGGGGTATPQTIAIAKKGLRNVLIHAGILDEQLSMAKTRYLSQPSDDCFHFIADGGMVEFCAALGDNLAKGDVIARVWPTGHTGRTSQEVIAKMDGLLTARHHPGLVQSGDCVAVLAVEE